MTTNASPSKTNTLLLQAVITHALWSTLHVSARYLQVYAEPTFDAQCVLASTKGFAALVLCLLEFLRARCCLHKQYRCCSRDKIDSISSTESEANDSVDASCASKLSLVEDAFDAKKDAAITSRRMQRKRIIFISLFALLSTCRASMNVASAKFTHPYNITLIGSIAPIMVAKLDAIFLGSSTPPLLWPTMLSSVLGILLIAISQSADKYKSSNNITPRDNAIGCSLQIAVVIMNSFGRILQKQTEGILTPIDIVQTGNVSNCVFPLIYTLYYKPQVWNSFRTLLSSPYSLIALLTISLVCYCFVSQQQVRLTRTLGPATFSSWSAVRILFSMVLSAAFLGEHIKSWMEWLGIGIMITSVSVYFVDVRRWIEDGKQREEVNADDTAGGSNEMVPMLTQESH